MSTTAVADPQAYLLDSFRERPDLFAELVLGVVLYPYQEQTLLALAGPKRRVAVRSANAVGKDFIAACAALWYPIIWDDVAVPTTGPTWHQLQDILWGREIHRLYRGARLPLGGRLLDASWEISPTRRAMAISTVTKEALQGIHAEHVLFIVDEASAREIGDEVWEAIDSVLASGDSKLLALGNPTRNEGAFYRAFHGDAHDWELIHVSAFDTPNLRACTALGPHAVPRDCSVIQPALVTHEWVESVRQRYSEDSDFWRVHVLGDFPAIGANTLIPLPWIEEACRRPRGAAGSQAPLVAGLDVARHGLDQTALAVLCDQDLIALEQWSDRSLMGTVGRVLASVRALDIRCLAIDDTNMHGVSDRIIEAIQTEQAALICLPVNWNSKAGDDRLYHNKPSEMWGRLRDNLSPEAPQPLSLAVGDLELRQQLTGQLARATYKFDSYGMGRLWVEKMGEGDDSPDLGDALALALEAWVQYYAGRRRRERVVYEDSFLGRAG